jgi:formylglycine-generating enzyme required for sulfatase activity
VEARRCGDGEEAGRKLFEKAWPENQESLLVMAHDVYISYAAIDKPVADAITASLESAGIRCWISPRDLLADADRGQAIVSAIEESRVLVLVFSSNANASREIPREIERAVNKGIPILPFRIEDVPLSKTLEYFISLPHWLDALTPPLEYHLQILTRKVYALLYGATPEAQTPKKRFAPAAMVANVGVVKLLLLTLGIALALLAMFLGVFLIMKRFIRNGPQISEYEFTVVTIDSQGNVTGRRQAHASSYQEDLGTGVSLEMVLIPGNTFWMGDSAEDVREILPEFRRLGLSQQDASRLVSQEIPQGSVRVLPYCLGKTEVTQRQWRRVASYPRVTIDLDPEPSKFADDDRPVEDVSWEEAVEFCARLARKTGRHYRLPSEGEWEYGCRAGTSTPYSFGNAITSSLVNFNGTLPWGPALPGAYRGQTTRTASFGIANAFGLFDMHGNVFEWCEDSWHDSYQGSPAGAKAWNEGGDPRYRVVRGGSFASAAAYCRSSYRAAEAVTGRFNDVGFRVALFADQIEK